jgi:hypothetical protein
MNPVDHRHLPAFEDPQRCCSGAARRVPLGLLRARILESPTANFISQGESYE